MYRKLALAFVLHDAPLRLLQTDEFVAALRELRPDFPQLGGGAAWIVSDLHASICAELDQFVRESAFVTLLCDRETSATATPTWSAVDDKRCAEPILPVRMDTFASADGGSGDEPTDDDATVSGVDNNAVAQLRQLVRHRLQAHVPPLLHYCAAQTRDCQLVRAATRSSHARRAGDPMLVGPCLASLSIHLLKELLRICPTLALALQKAGHVVDAALRLPGWNKAPFQQAMQDAALPLGGASSSSATADPLKRWICVVSLVHSAIAHEADIRASIQGESASNSSSNSSFVGSDDTWRELRVLQVILVPYHWLLAISESNAMNSGQYLVCWIWLLLMVKASPLGPTREADAFAATLVQCLRDNVDDHHFVCLLLDPRIHGVGLSALGKRKVKALVVAVAATLFPDAGYDDKDSAGRRKLLAQLANYMDRAGQFEDGVVWERATGKSPESFWNDFVEDASELTAVAKAVTAYTPQVRSCAAWLAAQQQQQPQQQPQPQRPPTPVTKVPAPAMATATTTAAPSSGPSPIDSKLQEIKALSLRRQKKQVGVAAAVERFHRVLFSLGASQASGLEDDHTPSIDANHAADPLHGTTAATTKRTDVASSLVRGLINLITGAVCTAASTDSSADGVVDLDAGPHADGVAPMAMADLDETWFAMQAESLVALQSCIQRFVPVSFGNNNNNNHTGQSVGVDNSIGTTATYL